MSPRVPSWLLAAVVVTAGLACGEIAGLDTFIRGQGHGGGATTTTTTTSGDSGGGGHQSSSGLYGGGGSVSTDCPDGKVEAPEVPAGWQGHVMILKSTSEAGLPACDGSAPVTLHSGLSVTPATCGCTCGPPLKNDCTATLRRHAQSDQGCTNTAEATKSLVYSCNPLSYQIAKPTQYLTDPAPAGICPATALPPAMDGASWDDHLRVCETAVVNVDEQGCTDVPPAPFDARLCILRPGLDDCPVDFPVGEALFNGFEDTRGCAADCACGAGSVQCNGPLVVHGDSSSCQSMSPQTHQPGTCILWIGTDQAVYYEATVTGSCTPGFATPTGDVVGVEPHTVCCGPLGTR